MNTFAHHKYAILILEGYMMALINGLDSAFYLFDPHARNSAGMPDPNGTAVFMKYTDINQLKEFIHSLSHELNTNLFEITPVQLTLITDIHQIMRGRLEFAKQCVKQKRSVETGSENKTRLQNDRNCQKRKLAVETESEKENRLANARKYYKKRKQGNNSHNQTVSNQHEYLKEFDIIKNGRLHERSWAKSNINKFHKYVEFVISQCTICQEAWPLKSKPGSPETCVCSRCSRDQNLLKSFHFKI